MTRALLLACLSGFLLHACSADPGPSLVASDVTVTAPRTSGGTSAAYLLLRNHSDADLRISRVSSPQFGQVAMHETVIEDGVARMRALPELVIPAGGSVHFEPGGRHLMLMQPVGATGPVQLDLWSGDDLLLRVETRPEPR